jgi:hypothetical protein
MKTEITKASSQVVYAAIDKALSQNRKIIIIIDEDNETCQDLIIHNMTETIEREKQSMFKIVENYICAQE